jgi:hypothetical protein
MAGVQITQERLSAAQPAANGNNTHRVVNPRRD